MTHAPGEPGNEAKPTVLYNVPPLTHSTDDCNNSPSLSFAHIVVDYSSDFIQKSLQIYDPPGLWDSTPTDRFPDPATELDAFLHYCNHSREHLTSFLYLVTREMAEKGEEGDLKPLITHDPFVYSKLFALVRRLSV